MDFCRRMEEGTSWRDGLDFDSCPQGVEVLTKAFKICYETFQEAVYHRVVLRPHGNPGKPASPCSDLDPCPEAQ